MVNYKKTKIGFNELGDLIEYAEKNGITCKNCDTMGTLENFSIKNPSRSCKRYYINRKCRICTSRSLFSGIMLSKTNEQQILHLR